MKSINILYYNHYFGDRSGSGQSSKILLDLLIGLGHSVTVVTTDLSRYGYSKEEVKWRIVPKKIKVEYGNFRDFLWTLQKYIVRTCINFYLSIKNDDMLKKEKYEIVLVNFIGGHELFTKYPYTKKTKKIFIVRGSINVFSISNYGGGNYNVEEIKNIFNCYDLLLFVAHSIINNWIESTKFEHNRKMVYYIPNCINEKKIEQTTYKNKKILKNKLGFKDQYFNIVQIGSVQEVKGQDLIISNFNEIKKICPNVKIYFVGNISSEWGRALRTENRLKQYSDDIIFLGHKNNPLEYLFCSDLVIHPSRGEALPRTVIEAMALGCIIIASDVDGHKELIDHGKTGFLFNIDNPIEISTIINNRINNHNVEEIGRASREYCFGEYSEKKMQHSYSKLFDDIIL